MKKSARLLKFLALCLLIATLLACTGRLPQPKTAAHAVEKYFKKYSNRYEESDFGKFRVDEVEVSKVEDSQHHLAHVEAYVSLGDGDVIYKVRATMIRTSFRWKVISWENLGRSS